MKKLDPTGQTCVKLGDALSLSGTANGYDIKMGDSGFGSAAAKPVVWLYEYITYVTWFSAQGIYEGIANNNDFRKILTIFVGLTIALYSIALVAAIIPYKLYELIVFSIKLSIVFAFATNWDAFSTVIFTPIEGELGMGSDRFTVTTEGAVLGFVKIGAHVMGAVTDESDTPVHDVLNPIDNVLLMAISWNFWKVIFALLASGLQGWIYAFLLIASMVTYFWAIMSALQVFFTAIIVRCLLYSVAPLFFVCLLFSGTKNIFFAWTEQLLSYCLQPILLFIWLGMINMHIIDFIDSMPVDPAQEICYLPYISLPIVSFMPKLHWWIFGSGTQQSVESRGPFSDIPLNFWFIIGSMLLSYLLKHMTDWTVQLAASLAGGVSSLAGVHGYGYETVKGAAQTPFTEGLAMFRGGLLGTTEHGMKTGGLVGAGWQFVRGKGFQPMKNIVGGASSMQQKARRRNIKEVTDVFNKEFGLKDPSAPAGKSSWSGYKKSGTGDLNAQRRSSRSGGGDKKGDKGKSSPWS